MATRNDRSGLEPFLGGSLLVHALLAVGLAFLLAPVALIPATVAEKKPEVVEPPKQGEEPAEPEAVKAVAAAQEEIRKVTRAEIAREQLKPTFDKLVDGQLPPQEMGDLWDDILLELDSGLLDLAGLLERQDFDLAQFNEKLQQLRAEMLKKLEEKLAIAAAKGLTEPLKQALQEQVGKPIGEAINQALEAEQRAGQALLQKAATDLENAAKLARQAEAALKQSRANLEKAQQDLDAAAKVNDAKGRRETLTRVRTENAKLNAAQKQLDQANKQADATAQRVQERHPEIATPVREAAKDLAQGKDHVPDAVKNATEGQPKPAADVAEKARAKAEQGAAKLEKLADAARLQAAREQVAQAARQVTQAARYPEAKQLEKAEAAIKAAVPALEQAKRTDAAKEAKAAQEKVEAAKAARQPRPYLNEAGEKLAAANELISKELARLGVKGTNPTDAILKELEGTLPAELAKRVDEKLPALLERKLDPQAALALKKLEPGKVVAEAARERLPDRRDEGSGPHLPGGAQKVQAAGLAQLDRLLGNAVASAVKASATYASSKGSQDLLRKVAGLNHGPGTGSYNLFGSIDGASVAGLRLRVQQAQGSLGRGHARWDGAAYQKMLEHLKGRDSITGDIIGRTGAEGAVVKPGDEVALRPAFVGIGSPAEVTKPAAASERKVPDPTFKTHRFSGIPLLGDEAITLDGDLTDWKDIPALILNPVLKGAGKGIVARPDKQVAYAAWCGKGLLLAFDVHDTSGAIENAGPLQGFWLLDGVEVYLDTMNTKASKRGETHTHQFFIPPFGHKDQPERGGFESFIEGGGIRVAGYDQTAIRRAAKRTERGWTLEVLLSKELLRKADLEPGRVVGFNLQVDTGTDLYYYWTAAEKFMTSMHPNTWGDLQLLGSDAKLTFVDENNKVGVEAVVPGKALRVQVEDPDMNTHADRKDRVAVTVRTTAGLTRTVVLEETTPSSGVFVGSIATTLHIGGNGPPTALPVLEGETLTAEYLDQVRAFGERNEKVTGKLPVASLGTQLGK